MANSKFSIIIPVYKTEAFLEQCLNSIANQTFVDFECIVLSDGSPGNSIELNLIHQDAGYCPKISSFPSELPAPKQAEYIFNEIVGLDSRFSFSNHSNIGVGATRNAGIEKSTGDYLLFLDSDDYLSLDFLEIFAKSIDHNPEKKIFYSTVQVNKNGIYSEFGSLVNNLNSLNSLSQNLIFPSRTATPFNYCWSRQIVNKYNIRFPTTKAEDTIFWFENIINFAKEGFAVDKEFIQLKAICFYRQFSDQMTRETSFQIELFHYFTEYMKPKVKSFFAISFAYGMLAILFYIRFQLYLTRLKTKNMLVKIFCNIVPKFLTVLAMIIASFKK
jgi:glycosyltransferase involved in cell wall biosynthesis